jgi:peroxin-2
MLGGVICPWYAYHFMHFHSYSNNNLQENWRKQAWVWLQRLDNAYKLMSILNFCVFLYNGKYLQIKLYEEGIDTNRYVSLVGRLLAMRLVYFRPNMSRRVSFELMNRQLVWHGFAVRFFFFFCL